MKIILNFVPPSINEYIGRNNEWRYRNDKKKVHKAIVMQTIGINPKIKKCKMKIVFYFKDAIRRDPSNFDKMLLDGLVQANIIEDDNYKVIEELTLIGKVDRGNPRTEIEIEEVE
jgi:Holliday junction resolvase RusA-like endonuclease